MKKSVFAMAGILAVMVAVAAFAGSLDAPSAPGATNSYTLDAIWNRLNDGTDGAQSTFTEPGATPASTGHTINDVMTKAPVKDDTNGAVPADVLTGKTFWGLTSGKWGLQTGTAASLPTETLRKTGQTTSYAAGDDGALEKGAAITSRFTPNGNGTVTDNLTGLIWLQNTKCWGSMTSWTVATTNAATLANGSCGLTDGSTAGQWRLPTVKELQSLFHFGYSYPALSNDAGDAQWGTSGTSSFTDVVSSYWSATDVGSTSRAMVVDLRFGSTDDNFKADHNWLWPVR